MARFTYGDAGYNTFFSRSLDASTAANLEQQAAESRRGNYRELNYDQSPTSGSLGSIIRVGEVEIDGVVGKISVYEGTDEVVRIGELDA